MAIRDDYKCPWCGTKTVECYKPGHSYNPETLLVYPSWVCPTCRPGDPLLDHTDPVDSGVPWDHPFLKPEGAGSYLRDLFAKFPDVPAILTEAGFLLKSS